MSELLCIAVFRYYFAQGLSLDDCYKAMNDELNASCPPFNTVRQWYMKIAGPVFSERNEITEEIIKIVKDYIQDQPNSNYEELESVLHIKRSMLEIVIHNYLSLIQDSSGSQWVSSPDSARSLNVHNFSSVDTPALENQDDKNIVQCNSEVLLFLDSENQPTCSFKKEESLDISDESIPLNHEDNNSDCKDVEVEKNNKNRKREKTKPSIHEKVQGIDFVNNRYRCIHCKITFNRKCHAQRHLHYLCQADPSHQRRFYCKECSRHYSRLDSLKRHLKRHLEKESLKKPFNKKLPTYCYCYSCHRQYLCKNSLSRHVAYECNKVPRFNCAHCEYRTIQKINLVRHLSRRHGIPNKLEPSTCPNCKRIYKNACSLKRHLDFECGKKPSFACDLCKYKAKRKSCLVSHLTKMHDRRHPKIKSKKNL